MITSSQDAPLIESIRTKIDQVVRLLRAECKKEDEIHWEQPCRRVAEKTGLSVFLVEHVYDFQHWSAELRIHGNMHLNTALAQKCVVVSDTEWRLVFHLRDWKLPDDGSDRRREDLQRKSETETDGVSAEDSQACTPGSAGASISQTGTSTVGASPIDQSDDRSRTRSPSGPPIYNEACLIREFDRCEQERGPIYAGFIVNTLLPGMGFESSKSKQILKAMEAQSMVRTESKPNPKNPERSTTFVTLNRQHPTVRQVLGENESSKAFDPVPIRGEPLSETIKRERR